MAAPGGKGGGGNKGGGNKGVNPYKGLTPGQVALTDPTNLYLAGNAAINAAHAVANAQTQGPLGELARQIAQTNKGTQAGEKLTGGYFTQFGKSAQQGVQDEAAIGNQLQSTLSGIGANTDTALQGLGQNAQSAIQSYMPAGDPSLSSPAMQSLTAEIARQRGYASQYGGIAQTSGALQSANYGGMAAAEKGIGAAAGTQALGEIARAGRLAIQPLTSKEATLDQTRGALYANALNQIHQQNVNTGIAEQGLGNTAAGIASTAANEAANRAATAKQDRLNRQTSTTNTATTQAGETKREQIIQRNENKRAAASRQAAAGRKAVAAGNKPSLTPYEQRQTEREFGLAVAYVQVNKHKGFSAQEITTNAPNVLKAGYDPLLVQAALEYVQGGGSITPRTAQALNQQGVRHLSWTGTPVTVRRSGPSPSASVGGVNSAGQGAAGGVTGVAG